MILRFQIPIKLDVIAPDPESLSLQTTLTDRRYPCSIHLTGSDPFERDWAPEERRYRKQVTSLLITISEDPSKTTLKSLVETKSYKKLVKLFRSLTNRILQAIRNAGMVPLLRQLYDYDGEDYEATLTHWKAESDNGDGSWKPLVITPPGSRLFLAMAAAFPLDTPELRASKWPEIDEAIQDNLTPPPEQEFTVNAIEHLRQKNLRLALLESIIGLEIVLTRHITEHLKAYTGIPKERIKKFLSPSFGLTARLSGILDLTLTADNLKDINLKKILAAVKWRNAITHGTGHLPQNLPDSKVRDVIGEVLTLITLLTYESTQAAATPAIRAISWAIYEKHKLSRPTLWILHNHRVLARFAFFPRIEGFPSAQVLIPMVDDLTRHLKERDSRFEPDKHLVVHFLVFPNELRASWRKGNLEFAKEDANG